MAPTTTLPLPVLFVVVANTAQCTAVFDEHARAQKRLCSPASQRCIGNGKDIDLMSLNYPTQLYIYKYIDLGPLRL